MEITPKYISRYYNVKEENVRKCLRIVGKRYGITEKEAINHIYTSMPRSLKILSGPFEFVFYKDVMGKRILLLSEAHMVTHVCKKESEMYEEHNWLYDLAKTSDKCLDIFVENYYRFRFNKPDNDVKNLESYQNPISAITAKLGGVKFDTTRYHYSDLRFVDDSENILMLGIIPLIVKHNSNNKIMKKVESIASHEDNKKVMEYVLGINRTTSSIKHYHDYYIKLYGALNNKKRINDKAETNYLKIIDKRIKKLDPKIDKAKFLNTLVDIETKYEEEQPISAILSAMMDVYLLTRLFTKFKVKNRGPESCKKADIVENAIIHAGQYHCLTYEKFFNLYFNALPTFAIKNTYNYTTKYYDQCIRFKNPFDFWA